MAMWDEIIRGLLAVPTGGMSEMVGRRNQLGRTVTGGLEGAGGGFLTGGPVGAVMGAGTGAGLSGTGATDPYSLKGGGINVGSGVGAGGMAHLPALMGSMGSGAGTGAGGGASGPSPVSMALQSMRGQPQQPPVTPQNRMQQFYSMFPNLRPQMGGFNNGIRRSY